MKLLNKISDEENFRTKLNSYQFEEEIAGLFIGLGFLTDLVSDPGDKGVDILLKNKGKLICVQCKAHKNKIGPRYARELLGSMTALNAQEGILINIGGFTSGVYEFTKNKKIKLYSLKHIFELKDKLKLAKIFIDSNISPSPLPSDDLDRHD